MKILVIAIAASITIAVIVSISLFALPDNRPTCFSCPSISTASQSSDENNQPVNPSSNTTQTNQITNTKPNNSLDKGAQVDLTNVSVWTCGAGRKIATFVGTDGFVNITRANEPDKGLPLGWNDFFDFVLKPNSTGYINMSFEFGEGNYAVGNGQFNGTIQSSLVFGTSSTVSDIFNKTVIYTLDDPYSSPHIYNLNGITIFATNIDNVTNHTLRLTYVIKIDSSAKEGTYGLGIPYTCPIELLTVGDKPYMGPIPWHRSIY